MGQRFKSGSFAWFWLKISHEVALICQLGMRPSNTAGVPNLQGLMPNDRKWSWCNNDRNKLHNKCNALGSSQNHAPIPWSMENLSSTKPVAGVKKVGDHCIQLIHMARKLMQLKCLSIEILLNVLSDQILVFVQPYSFGTLLVTWFKSKKFCQSVYKCF